ncbi:MAG: S9 family peptidase, partial [Bacteroidetes bacterium]|nr:S9 family peptidase [Bacteroidota bacterium]
MNKFYKLIFVGQLICFTAAAQNKTFTITENVETSPKANYQLASRFSTNKLKKLIFSTNADPHWLKLSHRFWYPYESPSGKQWYIVDPVAKRKNTLFDLDKLAAEITLVVRDAFDAQHLPIEELKFSKDEKSVTFEIKSSIDELKPDRKDKKAADSLQKKIFSFNYELANQKLTQIENYQKPKAKPKWASVAPDSLAIIFSRNYNIYWMDKENYKK